MNLPEPLPPAEQAHCRRTAALSEMLAKLAGLPDSEVRTVTQSALVHDIGKTAIPIAILCKPGPLTEEERVLMHVHTTVGARIISSWTTRTPRWSSFRPFSLHSCSSSWSVTQTAPRSSDVRCQSTSSLTR